MSIENAKGLLAKLKEDNALKHKVHDAGAAGFAAVAAEAGFDCTAEEMHAAIQESAGELELSEADLEKVAGAAAVAVVSVAVI